MDGHAAQQTSPAPSSTTSKTASKPEGVTKRTKSRNGCRECKAKRLKCDETKPDCQQCTKRGKECPGYVKDFKFSAKHERLHSADKQPKRGGSRVSFSTDVPARRASQASNSQHSPPVSAPSHVGHVIDFAAPSPLVQSVSQNSIESPAPGTPNQTSSSPRSGYLSWAEVLSPAPTIDEDEDLDIAPQTPQSQAVDNGDVDIAGAQAPASPVSLLSSPEPGSSSLVLSRRLSSKGSPRMLYTPVDLPSTLIEYWFTNVSSMWSAYDGPSNPNRQLALSNHSNSESVFYALQSMSAAYRVDSLPHLKPILTTSLANAMTAIRRELDVHYDRMPNVNPQLPVDLLLAMFAMATSLCWTDTSQLGEQLVIGARALLDLYGMSEDSMSESDQKHLQHFRHALIYMEMLHNFVNPNAGGNIEHLREHRRSSITAKDLSISSQKPGGARHGSLHPWTGVSSEIQEKFGIVMALCREHLRSKKAARRIMREGEDVRSNLELARELAEDLDSISFHAETPHADQPYESAETGDDKTPLVHLVDTAEAYRLAALLQLHITFDEPHQRATELSSDRVEELPRESNILALALELVNTLKRIPAESGTRCIQPVLYISAATGLKFDLSVTAPNPDLKVTECTVEVSRARQFVVDRLVALQRSLPPRPITVALRLIKAVWEEYDYGGKRHWTDIMKEDPGLQTLFG